VPIIEPPQIDFNVAARPELNSPAADLTSFEPVAIMRGTIPCFSNSRNSTAL
jgi:hypothetical protein